MRKLLLTVLLCALPLVAQTPQPPQPAPAVTDPVPLLAQLQQVAQTTAIDVGRVHIDKWSKSVREQAAHDADSLRNDVTNNLPALLAGAQQAPNSIAPALKLYVNVNALYEVLDGLVAQAATGPKEDFELLAADRQNLSIARRAWSDRLQTLAQLKDAGSTTTSSQATGNKQLPKKVIVDDTAPTHKRTTKKKPASQPPQ